MTKINIIFSTKNEENTNNIIESIVKLNSFEKNKNYSLSIIIFDKTIKQNIKDKVEKFSLNIKVSIFLKFKNLRRNTLTSLVKQIVQQKLTVFKGQEYSNKYILSITLKNLKTQLFGK